MLACLLIPDSSSARRLRSRPRLAVVPAASRPSPAGAARRPGHGGGRGGRGHGGDAPGEALATCPELVLVDPDPAGAEREWEGVLRRLEDAGFAVEPVEPGVVVFETRGVERLYGGAEAALRRALVSVGPAWDPRAGAGRRRFVALAAASVARPGQAVIVEGEAEQTFLEPLPLLGSLLPLDEGRYAELEGLGVRTSGLAALPGGAVAERLGQEGKRSLARGGERRRVRGRSPAAELIEALSFPRRSGTSSPCGGRSRAARPPARAARASRAPVPQAGALRPARRRRLVAAHRDAPRGDRRRPHPLGARPEARRDPGARHGARLEAVELAEHWPATRARGARGGGGRPPPA